MKYNKYYFYLFIYTSFLFSFFDQPTGQTRGFFRRDSSKDVKSRKDVPFWGLNDVPLNGTQVLVLVLVLGEKSLLTSLAYTHIVGILQ